MTKPSSCPCGSGNQFAVCCEPFLAGQQHAPTPETLMRSRYTAYVVRAIPYLRQTTHSSTRKYYSERSLREWAETTQWLKLEIHAVTENTVTFAAYYLDSTGFPGVHREHSTFRKEGDRWYFVDGSEPR